jgi:DNA-binding CsgD family transcriptional regulator
VLRGVVELEQGREACARLAWADAYERLMRADRATPLGADDLELLATSSYMLGRDEAYLGSLARAYRRHVEDHRALRAARCAFWSCITLMLRGESGGAGGWFGRAQRLIEREGGDCVERGYLLTPRMLEHEASGDYAKAATLAAAAVAIAERFADQDLFALVAQSHGNLLVLQGQVVEGLGLLDEAMVAVTAGELSPIVSGLVYCGVILGCRAAYEPRRAQEWTTALAQWCEQQPDMVAFTGRCLTHRAEIMCLHGAWPAAFEEARRARARCGQTHNPVAGAEAVYVEGEIHRLRGALAAAEEAYREASRGGREPQPGLALLRLAQGDGDAAAATIRRALAETAEPVKRAGMLPACVEIMLAVGAVEEAREACVELEQIAEGHASGMLGAMAAQARGQIDLDGGAVRPALVALRRAARAWQQLDAPYEAARARALVGLACRSLGDRDAAAFELRAAGSVFARLGAEPDVARVESLASNVAPADEHGLTARELQVLRLVAVGSSNREIAAELVVSEHTVARHLQNIFAKLGVSSRTAATAFAFTRDLL